MLPTGNFAFLAAHDPQLLQLGALAERYFRDDPGTTNFKLRQFAELLSKSIAARHALYLGDRETFEDKRSQVMFMDRGDILNLFTVTNLPLPAGALPDEPPTGDEMPF